MCQTCGCGDPGIVPVDVHEKILAGNDRTAGHNREHFIEHGVLAVNLMGSPGSGKTAILEATSRALGGAKKIRAVSGDLATHHDAERLSAAGIPSVAITTGSACHLDAEMVHHALHDIPLAGLDIFFIENVGNLVCPAVYDLGQAFNVVALSVTEGEDKPLKYPVMFHKADLVLLTKVDLLPHLGIRVETIEEGLACVMPKPELIRVSAKTGEGVEAWIRWLEARRAASPGPGAPAHRSPIPPRRAPERRQGPRHDLRRQAARRIRGRHRRVRLERLRVELTGLVQGVGFRPFVYRLASELELAGWVLNDTRGVFIEVEGDRGRLERFLARLKAETPPRAQVQTLESAWLAPAGFTAFEIRHSDEAGAPTAPVLPDIATCSECLAEVRDPADRRHRYPFANCTNCGPRFTIVRSLPYDRPRTTMASFALCPDCRAEYGDPRDRRFHAQPNACPACGPSLTLLGPDGATLARGDGALRAAAAALREGRIVAVKGLGGFHLMVDARNGAAVASLRGKKPRREKPFALMVRDLDEAALLCELPDGAGEILSSPEAPILLLPRRPGAPVAAEVAPGNPNLGVMLAATPLHHLLLGETGFPVVATSGNLSDEPICTGEDEALSRLGAIADLFLVHDRPIARHVDDSVGWIVGGALRLLRRARGYAPRAVLVRRPLPAILAVGAHLKNTVALAVDRRVFLSQHIGDLDTPESMAAFERVIGDFLRLYDASPVAVAHDLHPDYLSTKWALAAVRGEGAGMDGAGSPARPRAEASALAGARLVPVQHHHAHLAACLAENEAVGIALGATWDGTGYGTDGTVWGGEFLLGSAAGFERVAHLRPFRLPGGEAAVREPRRAALALLFELEGEAALEREELAPVGAFAPGERALLARMLARGVNSPVTTSAGRLFDAVSSLIGLRQEGTFEGQAAMELEWAAEPGHRDAYPLAACPAGSHRRAGDGRPEHGRPPLVLDWGPLIAAILEDLGRAVAPGLISARFHNALAAAIVAVAREVGEARVALSGGCFQNRRLTEAACRGLEAAGFQVLLHRQVPPNDGGISLGQAAVAAAALSPD